MPGLYDILLITFGSFGLGVCVASLFLLPWRTLAIQQGRWIQAKQDITATMVSEVNNPYIPLPKDTQKAEANRASELYRTALSSGYISDAELAELTKAGGVAEPIKQ